MSVLNPETSNDTETLGLWGAVHKRLWDSTKESGYLDEAARSYERGFYLRNDYYNGINFAYLLNVRAAHTAAPAEAIADFVLAQRVRREVLEICEELLKTDNLTRDAKYWVQATQAEAYFGVDDQVRGQRTLDEALAMPVDQWFKHTTNNQINRLKIFLADSPLKHIKVDDA